MLKFTREETTRVLGKGEEHRESFRTTPSRVEAEEDPTEVREWSQKIEGELAEFEEITEELQTRMRA